MSEDADNEDERASLARVSEWFEIVKACPGRRKDGASNRSWQFLTLTADPVCRPETTTTSPAGSTHAF
jgi:hypothetical protein